jgi:SsrA-binding protein
VAEKTVAQNRKAQHDFEIIERLEAGLVLTGSEIKAIREGKANLQEAFARPERGELWLLGAHIGRYGPATYFGHEPARPRKLLLHRGQINDLAREVEQKGLTLVPLRLYLKDGIAKVELGLGRGRRQYDKRQAIARREAEREMQRALRSRNR